MVTDAYKQEAPRDQENEYEPDLLDDPLIDVNFCDANTKTAPALETLQANHSTARYRVHACRKCETIYTSGNKLHAHLRTCLKNNIVTDTHLAQPATNQPWPPIVIKSEPSSTHKFDGLSFRSWYYATAFVSASPKDGRHEVCIDSGYTMSIIDKCSFQKYFPEIEIRHTAKITVRGIDSYHLSSEYAVLTFYFEGLIEEVPATCPVNT